MERCGAAGAAVEDGRVRNHRGTMGFEGFPQHRAHELAGLGDEDAFSLEAVADADHGVRVLK